MFLVKASYTGMSLIRKAAKSADKQTRRAARRGMVKGGLFLQRESQKIVPIDTTNLQGSAVTRDIGTPQNPDVVVAYGRDASYSVYVHENPHAHHAPGKRYKFLEEPARTKRKEIMNIIATEASKG